jgi:chromosome segregation ATPase
MDNKNKTQLNNLLKKDLVQYAINLQVQYDINLKENFKKLKEVNKNLCEKIDIYKDAIGDYPLKDLEECIRKDLSDFSYKEKCEKLKEEISMLHNVINEYKKDNEKIKEYLKSDNHLNFTKLKEENEEFKVHNTHYEAVIKSFEGDNEEHINIITDLKEEIEKLKEGEEKAYDYIIEINKLREENKKLEKQIEYMLSDPPLLIKIKKLQKQNKIKDKQITELTLQLH